MMARSVIEITFFDNQLSITLSFKVMEKILS